MVWVMLTRIRHGAVTVFAETKQVVLSTIPPGAATQGNFVNDMIWGSGKAGRKDAAAKISSEAGSVKCQGMERNFPWQVVLLSVSLASRRLTAPGNPSHHSSGVTNEQPDFIICMVTAACS